MFLNEISLVNFRNYSNLNLNFDKNINIFIGNNAQGKTNILESIYFLSVVQNPNSFILLKYTLPAKVNLDVSADLSFIISLVYAI